MIYIKLDARFVTPPPFFHIVLKTPSKAILVNEPMLLWLVVRCNTDRINYAYATNHGRFGKTIGE